MDPDRCIQPKMLDPDQMNADPQPCQKLPNPEHCLETGPSASYQPATISISSEAKIDSAKKRCGEHQLPAMNGDTKSCIASRTGQVASFGDKKYCGSIFPFGIVFYINI